MGKGGDNTNNNNNDSQPVKPVPGVTDFYWSASDEPHATRRKLILAKYPQIKQLYGHCIWLKYKVLACIVIQTTLAYTFRSSTFTNTSTTNTNWSWWMTFWMTAYIVGGTCNHMCMMALHELSHNLGFAKMQHNRYFAMFVANLPIAVPAAVTFKRYHMEHHKYQGVDTIDVDIPTTWEGQFFTTPITKFLFCVFQVAFYALRPSLVNPKPPGAAEILNIIVVLSFDATIVYLWGWMSLFYLLASSWLGMGLHPVAGHFIAEHYVFPQDIHNGIVPETYSYYGIVNYFTFNVGYHNEHHDFPFIPGSRLPQVKQIAAEFYDVLPHHTSYTRMFYNYIMNDTVTAFSRVKRIQTAPDPDGVVTDIDHAVAAVDTTAATVKPKAE